MVLTPAGQSLGEREHALAPNGLGSRPGLGQATGPSLQRRRRNPRDDGRDDPPDGRKGQRWSLSGPWRWSNGQAEKLQSALAAHEHELPRLLPRARLGNQHVFSGHTVDGQVGGSYPKGVESAAAPGAGSQMQHALHRGRRQSVTQRVEAFQSAFGADRGGVVVGTGAVRSI